MAKDACISDIHHMDQQVQWKQQLGQTVVDYLIPGCIAAALDPKVLQMNGFMLFRDGLVGEGW